MEIGTIVLLLLLLVIYFVYNENINNDLLYVKSKKDGRKYLVRNKEDKDEAADMMALIREKLVTVKDYLQENYTEEDRVQRLINKFNPNNIIELEKNSKNTSYSINKGEKIVFCLRSKDKDEKLVDMNTMMFVALHEMAHIMTESVGHTDEFWSNFKFLLKKASKLGIYKPTDYNSNPQEYCGMKITDTPLMDENIK